MKIDPTLKPTAPGGVPEERSRLAKPGAAPRQSRASVEVSPLASQLQSIDTGGDAAETVDASRVAEVKLAIAEGRYQVDAETIADRLLESARETMRARK